MKILDLWAGMRGWSLKAGLDGHDVIAIERDKQFSGVFYDDINHLSLPFLRAMQRWGPDLILASPPCEGFTVMNIGKNWYHDGTPKTDRARQALVNVQTTLDLIRLLQPHYWVIENPRGKLRALEIMAGHERRTVTYCQLGESRMKPTDLWGGFPPSLVLPEPCKNGDSCHVRAPRGSRTPGSVQGQKGAPDRAKIPQLLADLVIGAAQRDLANHNTRVNTTLWGNP
jgi:hypothetical protein